MRNYLFLLSFVVFGILFTSRADGQAHAWNVYVDSISQWANTEQPTVIDAQGDAWFLFWDNDSVCVGRFDGTNWTHYGPAQGVPRGYTHSIIRDHAGNLWMSADSGIAEFTDGSWHSYKIQDKLTGIRTYHALAADSSGDIWVATFSLMFISNVPGGTYDSDWNELYRFDGTTWTSFTPPYIYNWGGFSALAFTPDGTLWAGGADSPPDTTRHLITNGLSRYDGTSWQSFNVGQGTGFTTRPAGGGAMTIPEVTAIHPDKNGGVWVSLNQSSPNSSIAVYYFNGSTWDTTGELSRRFTDLWIAPNSDKYFRSNIINRYGYPVDSGALVIVHVNGSLDSIPQSEIPFFPFTSIAFASDGTPWLTFSWAGSTRLGVGLETMASPSVVISAPKPMSITSAYPNPFHTSTNISYTLAEDSYVTISLFNSAGIRVASLASENEAAGEHTRAFDGSNLPDGSYRAEIQSVGNDGRVTRQSVGLSLIR